MVCTTRKASPRAALVFLLCLAAAALAPALGCTARPLTTHHDRALELQQARAQGQAEQPALDDDAATPRLVALAAGQAHVCAIDLAGDVLCWGSHHAGQLGQADLPMWNDDARTTTRSWTPLPVDGVRGAAEISAGVDHTCARHATGARLDDAEPPPARTVSCWGRGQPQASRVGIEDAVGIASGAAHTCALTSAGALTCWAWRDTLDPARVDALLPGAAAEAEDASALATEPVVSERPAASLAPEPLAVPPLDGTPIAVLAAGHVTCAALDTGRIGCWSSRLGQAPQLSYLPAAGDADDFDVIAMDSTRLCTTRHDGNVLHCWDVAGLNWAHDRAWSEVRVGAPERAWIRPGVEALLIDTGRACGIYEDGVDCQLLEDVPMPMRHPSLPTWVQETRELVDVASAWGWGCVVDASGQMRCWGEAATASSTQADGALAELAELESTTAAALEPLECPMATRRDHSDPRLERCVDDRGLGSGLARHYGPDGGLRAEGRYRADLREGRWTEWSDDGHIRAEGNYRNGERDGSWRGEHLESGRLAWRGDYREGRMDGAWIFTDADGRELHAMFDEGTQTAWQLPLGDGAGSWRLMREPDGRWSLSERDATGNVRARTGLVAPQALPQWTPEAAGAVPDPLVLDGEYSELYANGTPAVRGHYLAGQLDGTWETFHPNGQKASERTFAAGRPEGTVTDWHDNGQKAREGRFNREGQPDGLWLAWHPDGQKASEGRFDDGLPTGRWSWWYEDGTLARRGSWRDPDDLRLAQLDEARAGTDSSLFENAAFFQAEDAAPADVAGADEAALPDVAAHTVEQLRAIEALLIDGVADGTWQRWHPNGQLAERADYVRGEQRSVERWDESGQPAP